MENKPEKSVTIIVNTKPQQWAEKMISYKEVVILAFGSYEDNPKIVYTVEYFKGPKENPEGSLTKGESVTVKERMVFNVTKTDQS